MNDKPQLCFNHPLKQTRKRGIKHRRHNPLHSQPLALPLRAFLVHTNIIQPMKPAIRLALTAAIEVLTNIHVQRRVIAYLRLLRINTK